MTLTVRLQPDLESALELHCAERGVTKSLVVQEVLAEYLARPSTPRSRRADAVPAQAAEPSANYRAFEAAGLIGAGTLGGRPADKARVREVIGQRLAERKARRKG
jgi:predicted transcriptional regulator